MKVKKIWISFFVIVLAITMVGCGQKSKSSNKSTQTDNVLIGTAGEGGAFFYLGNGVADVINRNTSVKATAQATGGGVENIRRINSGEMDFGFITMSDLASTIKDQSLDPEKVMVLTTGHKSYVQVAVRADSEIKTFEQLFAKGKRVGVGEPGSAIQVMAEALLQAHGLTMEDINAAPLSQSEQSNALKDNSIDGAMLGGGVPVASISDLSTSIGVRILPATDELISKIQKFHPDTIPLEIPAGVYKGIDETVPVFGSSAVILVRSGLPEDKVYEILKAIHEHTDEIAKVHPSGKEYTIDNAFNAANYYINDLGLKYHPGAIKWYKEQGVWSGEYE